MLNESGNVKKISIINRRMFIISVAKFLVFTGIVTRLFSLQVNESKKYLTLSDKNRIREWKLPPTRGEILDYFGNVIAGNLKVYQLHLVPEQVEDFRYVMIRLKEILKLTEAQYAKIIKKKNNQKPWETLIISENLSWEQFTKVNHYLYELIGAKPVLSISRNYPYKDNFTHILGYVSQANEKDILQNSSIKENFVPGLKVGKIGLEKTLEKDLIGTNDIQRYEVNAYGKRINQLEYQKGKKGKTVRLTVDTEVQKLCNELLKDKAGSICVMDIFTGEIIAMHSSPSFDPNLFLFGINQDDWSLIRNNPLKPLTNKSVQGLYSPGSTIKPIVALSALENRIISPNFKVNCTGKMEMYGQTYHCWKKKGHGVVNLRNAMKQSCDTYFYEVARRLGVDRLEVTASDFGLGSKVLGNSFEIEKKGLVPTTKWKKNNLGKGWVLGETLITGIGQGYIQTTPLQLCFMTAQLANGGYKIYPTIIAKDDRNTAQEIKYDMENNLVNVKYRSLFNDKKNIEIVLDAMFGSTNEVRGTSYRSRIKDKKYQFAGKTGTSQVKRITEKVRELELKTVDIPYDDRDHALYVAFGPYVDPRYALSILVEHGGSGSSTAAPMAKKLFKLIIDRHELREKIINKRKIQI
jgi:penicillin-binding protein 2